MLVEIVEVENFIRPISATRVVTVKLSSDVIGSAAKMLVEAMIRIKSVAPVQDLLLVPFPKLLCIIRFNETYVNTIRKKYWNLLNFHKNIIKCFNVTS